MYLIKHARCRLSYVSVLFRCLLYPMLNCLYLIKNFSFESVKFYLSTKYRYSESQYAFIAYKKGNIVNKAVKDTRLE